MTRFLSISLSILIAGVFMISADSGCEGQKDLSTAKLAISKKQFDKAKESIDKAILTDSSNGEPYYLLGNIYYYEEKNYVAAAEAYSNAASRKLSREDRKKMETITLVMANDLRNEAVRKYNDGLEAYKSGDTTAAREMFTKSKESSKRAMALTPDTSTAYVEISRLLVYALSVLRENDEAVSVLQTIIQRSPNDTTSIQMLADVYMRTKKADQAASLLADSRNRGISSYTITQMLFESYAISEQYDELEKLLEEAISSATPARRAQYIEIGKGVLYQAGERLIFEEKRYEDAINKLDKAYKLDTTFSELNARLLYNMAAAYTRMGDEDAKAFKAANPPKKVKRGKRVIEEDVTYDGHKKYYIKAKEVLTPVAPRINKKPYWRLLAKIHGTLGENQLAQNALDAEQKADED